MRREANLFTSAWVLYGAGPGALGIFIVLRIRKPALHIGLESLSLQLPGLL